MTRRTSLADGGLRRRVPRPGMIAMLALGAALTACGNDSASDAKSAPDGGPASAAEPVRDPAAQFRLPPGRKHVSATRRAAARAADAGRRDCGDWSVGSALTRSIAAARRQTSHRGGRERRMLIAAAERLPRPARHEPVAASLAAALYSLSLPRADRLPGRAGCLAALLETKNAR